MRAPLGLLLIWLSGCSAGLELSVDLRSDLTPGVEVDEAVVRWERGGQDLGERSVPIGAGHNLAEGARLVDLSELAPGAHRVHVTLRRAGIEVGDRSRAFELMSDLAITIVITRDCRDDRCEPGACVTDAECVSSVACVRSRCAGLVCLDVPDDALCEGRCDPISGCAIGPIDGGADGGIDAGEPPPEDGGPGCASLDCSDPLCDGRTCDDGDLCTHGDRCGLGVCSGTVIMCVSSACVARSCNGTATCTETVALGGTACDDDTNACTNDVCRGSTCAHEARANGSAVTGFTRCCGGRAVNTSTDRAHCGGCGLACATGYNCTVEMGHPTCDCGAANAECHGGRPNFVCSTTYGVCACLPGGCPGTATCIARSGPDYCEY